MKTEYLDLRNCDCMDLMREYPDKHFDLAIVDPPYGLQESGNPSRMNGAGKLAGRAINSYSVEFDLKKPDIAYWDELFRVSENQVVWGGNYFDLPPTRGDCFLGQVPTVGKFFGRRTCVDEL